MPYDFRRIEQKWQRFWLEHKTFRSEIDHSKPKYYVLDMFPYPSGDGLHVGHPEGYTATDIVSRYKRMNGFNVLHPMGWDAFGLPAERHAVRTGEHPAVITRQNCDTFRRQIQRLGLSYDWDREINTTDPGYYKWTQWIFRVLYERGLAYEVEAPVNWCPALNTVLANEEIKDGRYVETGDPVERRLMRQWMLRITAYAQRLLDDLDELDWPEGIKTMQREWIGRSEGADVVFKVAGTPHSFMVFTTRPDTLFGATYCVLAPEHPLTGEIASADQADSVKAYIERAAGKSTQDRMKEEREKTGVFTGAYAVNPVNGAAIPIWTADYVLAEYGYGAIMAVPAHDTRDHAFAAKFHLPVVEVIQGGDVTSAAYTGDGRLIHSPLINGLRVPEAKKKMTAWLQAHGLGKGTVNYKLRDWLFSRQRYWGEPFPLLRLEDGSIRLVPIKDLPVMLPELDEYKPTSDGRPPLARASAWVNTVDAASAKPARRETNTMPQWAGSCWYYLRFCDPGNDNAAWSEEAEKYWMPVDLYIGGAEHAVLHLLYARFWHKVLYDAGLVSTKEPFAKLFNQGMILARSYSDDHGRYYYADQIEKKDGRLLVKGTDRPVHTQIEKMSKSRYNVVNPDDVVDAYGADTMRLYEMFMGPLDKEKPWTDEGVQGVHRFLNRVWRMLVKETGELRDEVRDVPPPKDVEKLLHSTIKAVTMDTEHLRFNTAISRMMEFVNVMGQAEVRPKCVMEGFLLLLAPYAPHLAEEIWQRMGHAETLAYASWPVYDESLTVQDEVEIPVSVNGRVRAKLTVSREQSEDEKTMEMLAIGLRKIRTYTEGRTVRRIIVVPGRMVNIVVK